jgi:hypothetical protein
MMNEDCEDAVMCHPRFKGVHQKSINYVVPKIYSFNVPQNEPQPPLQKNAHIFHRKNVSFDNSYKRHSICATEQQNSFFDSIKEYQKPNTCSRRRKATIFHTLFNSKIAHSKIKIPAPISLPKVSPLRKYIKVKQEYCPYTMKSFDIDSAALPRFVSNMNTPKKIVLFNKIFAHPKPKLRSYSRK